MIHAVLADDEVLARQKLRQFLHDEPEIKIIGESSTAAETIELVRAARPEVLFLDIRMPGMDGFQIVDALMSANGLVMPRIIFTTAYDGYAIRAFEIRAVDYLLKPFTAQRLHSAVENACEQIQTMHAAAKQGTHGSNGANGTNGLNGLNGASEANGANGVGKGAGAQFPTRIVFKSRGRILFLPVSDIRWISAEENYVRICTQTETHLLRETMSRLEEKLDRQTFLRVHRSSIVNLQYVKEVRTESDGECVVVLANGQKVTMSRSYRSRIDPWLHR